MAHTDFYVEQVALLLKKGRSVDEIAQRLGKTIGWVEEMSGDLRVMGRCDEMRLEDLKNDPELWDRDRYNLEIQAMGPVMVREAFKMAMNPAVSDATRAKMIELVLKYNENMPQPKETEGGGGPTIYIDEVVVDRLEALERSRAQRARLVGAEGPDGEDS